jgi:hypothetical protein
MERRAVNGGDVGCGSWRKVDNLLHPGLGYGEWEQRLANPFLS